MVVLEMGDLQTQADNRYKNKILLCNLIRGQTDFSFDDSLLSVPQTIAAGALTRAYPISITNQNLLENM